LSPPRKKQVDTDQECESNQQGVRDELLSGTTSSKWRSYFDKQFDRVISSSQQVVGSTPLPSVHTSSISSGTEEQFSTKPAKETDGYGKEFATEESRTTDKPTAVSCLLCTGEIDNKTSVSIPGKIRLHTSVPIMEDEKKNQNRQESSVNLNRKLLIMRDH
jgi:hypothetical protein